MSACNYQFKEVKSGKVSLARALEKISDSPIFLAAFVGCMLKTK
jgi:hypothetical protein